METGWVLSRGNMTLEGGLPGRSSAWGKPPTEMLAQTVRPRKEFVLT
jgi:hypothetical protein